MNGCSVVFWGFSSLTSGWLGRYEQDVCLHFRENVTESTLALHTQTVPPVSVGLSIVTDSCRYRPGQGCRLICCVRRFGPLTITFTERETVLVSMQQRTGGVLESELRKDPTVFGRPKKHAHPVFKL